MKHRLFRRRRQRAGQLLAAECEAYLEGRFLEWLQSRGEPVPAWAWLNGLAHGGPPVVTALAAWRGDPNDPAYLVAELASVVLGRIGRPDNSLAAVQQSKLLPLEMKLHQYAGSAPPEDAAELARWMISGLGRTRRSDA